MPRVHLVTLFTSSTVQCSEEEVPYSYYVRGGGWQRTQRGGICVCILLKTCGMYLSVMRWRNLEVSCACVASRCAHLFFRHSEAACTYDCNPFRLTFVCFTV